MTSFNFFRFLRIFGPQTIFISGWDMKFNFFRFFFKIFDLKQLKIVKFVFKRSNPYSNDQI
jgi:hypothetical protein